MFITLEGPDGSGKTTQARLLISFLQDTGHDVLALREPGGTPIGEQIRDVVHNMKNREMHDHTEVLLYVASRAQLVAQKIRPALAVGRIVVCDRYADSTLAYQGYGRGLDLEALKTIINFATDGLVPDLTLYFDVSAEEGIRRREMDAEGGGELNRLDAQAIEFHERVREGYAQLSASSPERWAKIDASQSIEDVHQRVCEIVTERLATS